MTSTVHPANPDVTMFTDASGALVDQNWFQLQWVGPIREYYITVKELVPIVLEAVIWGQVDKGKQSEPDVIMPR